MAFVRWRGTCAELLATVYENGRSRQILLANLPGPYASLGTRLQVTKEHPDISSTGLPSIAPWRVAPTLCALPNQP